MPIVNVHATKLVRGLKRPLFGDFKNINLSEEEIKICKIYGATVEYVGVEPVKNDEVPVEDTGVENDEVPVDETTEEDVENKDDEVPVQDKAVTPNTGNNYQNYHNKKGGKKK